MQQNFQQPQQQAYMGFGDAIQVCFNKFATFSGRATRAEYWWWYLFTFLVSCCTSWLGWLGTFGSILSVLIGLALFIPTLAVSWRRMHDIGKGGGWWFICFIPVVGWILWIVWCCQPSEPMENRFGPTPA